MLRRRLVIVAFVTAFGGLGGGVSAHSGLRASSPIDGATLGDTPTTVQLSFSEPPEASLSDIRVLDTAGAAYQMGRPQRLAGDPFSISVRVRPLGPGVYTVNWRIVSAVDGHATAGAYAFGVRASPAGPAAAAPTSYPAASSFEMLARWVFIAGLVALLGAASAGVSGFDGAHTLSLGAGGWLLAFAGLLLVGVAQTRNAAATVAELLHTPIGRALIWRAIALASAGAALAVARWRDPSAESRTRRLAMGGAALATLATMAVHVAAGHAAADRWLKWATVGAQWAHFAAAGIWLGGLAALLLDLGGIPSVAKADEVRRFSRIAAAGLLVVAATGVVRAVQELSSWGALTSSGYGRVVLIKSGLMAGIAALGALNRWWGVPAAAVSLRPLRRTASAELALAAGALAAAAVLGALPPPAAGLSGLPVIDVSGVDFGTTVRVRLTTASDQPGPNRFVVEVVDYDSAAPVRARRVSLRFTSLDDPGVAPTSLALAPGPRDSYVGSGANLALDGRWRVTVQIERASGAVEVPLEVEARGLPHFVSIQRIPGQAPTYTVRVTPRETIRISPDPERAGPSQVYVTSFDAIGDERPLEQVVVTAAVGDGPLRQQPVRRLDRLRFVADVELRPGRNRLAVVARGLDGARLRVDIEIQVPAR